MADLKAYTTVYSFPYPLPGDSVQNTYSRIQELAERIEATYLILDINLNGSAKLMQEGDPAGGDLENTYPNPSITSGAITNDKVAAGAAISYSKLNLANSIVSSDIVDGTITGSDITSSVSLSGNPTTTTQGVLDNSTRIATTEFVQDLFAESQGTAFDTHVQNVTDAHDIDIPNIVYTTDTGTVTSTMIANNTIVNADVNSSAAISYSKLALTNSIVNADVSSSAAIAYSKLNLTGSILNADLAGSIAYSKLSLTGAILDADLAGSISPSKITGTAITAADTGTVTSTMIANGTIVDADVNASAAIAPSKISGTAVITTDSRLSDSRTPTGSAGGDLTGSYPNPTLAATGTAGTYTKVTTDSKGRVTSGTTLAATDLPTTGTAGTYTKVTTDTYGRVSSGTTLVEADIPSLSPSKVTGTAVITTDSRLSDARTPTSHASTHVPGGSDVLDYTKIVGYGTSLPTWNATTHPAGVLWVVNTVGEPYSLYRSDGVSAWNQVGGGGASITVSDTAPSSPVAGAMWFDSTTGKTFIRYADGSSNQWVEIGEIAQLSIGSHGDTHVRGGSDVIDGDRVTIDYVPTRYTRNSGASGAGDVTDLTAHLGGIDNNLTSLWVPPMLRVRKNTTQSITAGLDTQLTWNVADINTDTMWSSGGDVTIKTTGVYELKAGALWGTNTTGRRVLYITLNGVGYNYHIAAYNWPTTSGAPGSTISTIYNLTINDILRVYVWQDSGSSINIPPDTNTHHLNSTFFSAVLVGKTA